MKKQVTIGVGEAATTAKELIDVWKLAERGETVQEKHRLHFENLEVLLKTLTPGRWALLKKLHANISSQLIPCPLPINCQLFRSCWEECNKLG
jgi:predicted transcriptional regulator